MYLLIYKKGFQYGSGSQISIQVHYYFIILFVEYIFILKRGLWIKKVTRLCSQQLNEGRSRFKRSKNSSNKVWSVCHEISIQN